jgi:hypothetical protein
MATKTFKIGEYCRGGVITIETTKTQVKVIAKEWDYSKGYSKGSDQSNAKEWNRLEVNLSSSDAESKVNWFLFDLTTSYYTDVILDWIKTKVTFNDNNW